MAVVNVNVSVPAVTENDGAKVEESAPVLTVLVPTELAALAVTDKFVGIVRPVVLFVSQIVVLDPVSVTVPPDEESALVEPLADVNVVVVNVNAPKDSVPLVRITPPLAGLTVTADDNVYVPPAENVTGKLIETPEVLILVAVPETVRMFALDVVVIAEPNVKLPYKVMDGFDHAPENPVKFKLNTALLDVNAIVPVPAVMEKLGA